MGRYLLAHQAAFGNNWFQVESTGLGVVALLFPAFQESERMWHCALRRLEWINRVCTLPDGMQAEGSTTYLWFPLRGLTALYELAQLAGRELPDGFAESLAQMLSVYVQLAQPDLRVPMLNDCNPFPLSLRQPMRLAAKLFPQREAFRYLSAGQREAHAPSYTSVALPHAGYYISRSGWDEHAFYLAFDAGAYGLGHQHEDKLNFVLHAHGRTLIHDPGIYQYKQDEFEPYWRGPRGHNTIMVDGKGQNRRLRNKPEARPDPDTLWVTGERFDFGLGWYKDGFATRSGNPVPRPPCGGRDGQPALPVAQGNRATEADRASRDKSLQHARALFVVKGAYVVLVDWVLGEGEHMVEQIFHLAPIVESEQKGGVRPGAIVHEANGVVRSAEPNRANVALVPAYRQFDVRIETGQLNPVRGWSALYGKQPSHDVTYSVRATLPETLPVVLWPQPAGQNALPQVKSEKACPERSRRVKGERGGGVPLRVLTAHADDLFILATQPMEMAWQDWRFDGQALWLRRDLSGTPQYVAAVRAKQFSMDRRSIIAAEQERVFEEALVLPQP